VSMTRWSRCMVRTVLRTCTVLSLRVTGYYHVFNAPEKMRARAREWPGRDPSRGHSGGMRGRGRIASPRLASPSPRSSKMKERCAAASWLRFLRIQQMHSYRPAAQNGSSRCGPGQCSTLSRPPVESGIWNLESGFWVRCRATSPSQEGYLQAGSCSSRSLCNPGSTVVGQVARQPAPHHHWHHCTTARLLPSGLKAESRNPSCHDDFQQPRPSSPPLTGRREARRPAAQDAGDPTAGEPSLAVPQPIEASEKARFSIVRKSYSNESKETSPPRPRSTGQHSARIWLVGTTLASLPLHTPLLGRFRRPSTVAGGPPGGNWAVE
jgi:hypothetical protein